MSEFEVGQSFEGAYPFIRDTYTTYDNDEYAEIATWRPGCRSECVYPDDAEAVSDGVGAILLTIVSIHKPGRYPERVFFTRRWRDPDGREFGKGKLHIVTTEKFRRLSRGYQHEYRVIDQPSDANGHQGRLDSVVTGGTGTATSRSERHEGHPQGGQTAL